MKRMTLPLGAALVVASLVTAVPAASAPTNFSNFLPPEKVQGAVAYVTGGIGLDEVNAIKQVVAQYPLELVFVLKAMPRDEYLSDIKVAIKDHAGKTVLDTTSGGPFLLAKLPDGKYSVSAERRGEIKLHAVQIKLQKHERLVFEWR